MEHPPSLPSVSSPRPHAEHISPADGYQLSLVEESPFLIPEITVHCVRRRLVPLFVGLLPALGKAVNVRIIERSPEPPFPPIHYYETDVMRTTLLASALWGHEDLLTSRTPLTVIAHHLRRYYPEELRLTPPDSLLLHNLPQSEKFLVDNHRLQCRNDVLNQLSSQEPLPCFPYEERLHAFLRQIQAVKWH